MDIGKAKIDIPARASDLQTGSTTCGIASVATITRIKGRIAVSAFTAIASGRIGQDGRIFQIYGNIIDVDCSDAAISSSTVAARQSVTTLSACRAGVGGHNPTGRIVLIKINCGIAASADTAIPAGAVRIAGAAARIVSAIAAGAQRLDVGGSKSQGTGRVA